jgi:hypothetical protein
MYQAEDGLTVVLAARRKKIGKMNYQNVKTYKELGEVIKEDINRHKVPCQDSITGETSMQLFTSLKTDDAQLAFIRLNNKFGVDLPVPNDLIELLDSCGIADRFLQDKSKNEKPAETERDTTPTKRWEIGAWLKKIPHWIYILVIFLAALLTCIYFLWWLWATFWKK